MNYTERMAVANQITEKLKTNQPLTDEEKKYIIDVLYDPLQEFCLREGAFRIVEILDKDPELASKLEGEAAEIVRDCIDYKEDLYDEIDTELRDLINKEEN